MSGLGSLKISKIELDNVSFRYGSGPMILNAVSVQIPIGKILHVTGPTGHGQSTFLKILACLSEPTAGAIRINGSDVTDMSFEEFLPYRLELGYTFEFGGLLSNRTLAENLALPQLYHGLATSSEIEARLQKIAERFRFKEQLERRPASVSSGLRKLVATLRPLILKPCVLVMDDPFAGLDPDTAKDLGTMIGEMREQGEISTVCFTSRDETWPGRLKAEPLWIESGRISFRSGDERSARDVA